MSIRRKEELQRIAEEFLSDTSGGHQIDHTLRVCRNAEEIAAASLDVNVEHLMIAAYLHDIGRGRPEEGVSHGILSARYAAPVLDGFDLSDESRKEILTAIEEHPYSRGLVPSSLLGRILQDADRIDAIGAIGVARAVMEGRGRPLYHRDDPSGKTRALDDSIYTIDHFYIKLLKIADSLHTEEARKIAAGRVRFMEDFLRQFLSEIGH